MFEMSLFSSSKSLTYNIKKNKNMLIFNSLKKKKITLSFSLIPPITPSCHHSSSIGLPIQNPNTLFKICLSLDMNLKPWIQSKSAFGNQWSHSQIHKYYTLYCLYQPQILIVMVQTLLSFKWNIFNKSYWLGQNWFSKT